MEIASLVVLILLAHQVVQTHAGQIAITIAAMTAVVLDNATTAAGQIVFQVAKVGYRLPQNARADVVRIVSLAVMDAGILVAEAAMAVAEEIAILIASQVVLQLVYHLVRHIVSLDVRTHAAADVAILTVSGQ